MRKRHMIISNIIKKVDLLLLQHQRRRNRMHRRVPPTLIEEPPRQVQMREVVDISRTPQPLQRANLKVRPEVAVVVGRTVVLGEPPHAVLVRDVLREEGGEVFHAVPERGDGLAVLVEGEHEGVFFAVLRHVGKGVVADVAEEFDGGLDAPVVLVFL